MLPMRLRRSTEWMIQRSVRSMWNLRRRQLWDGHYQMQASDFSLQTVKKRWIRK